MKAPRRSHADLALALVAALLATNASAQTEFDLDASGAAFIMNDMQQIFNTLMSQVRNAHAPCAHVSVQVGNTHVPCANVSFNTHAPCTSWTGSLR